MNLAKHKSEVEQFLREGAWGCLMPLYVSFRGREQLSYAPKLSEITSFDHGSPDFFGRPS